MEHQNNKPRTEPQQMKKDIGGNVPTVVGKSGLKNQVDRVRTRCIMLNSMCLTAASSVNSPKASIGASVDNNQENKGAPTMDYPQLAKFLEKELLISTHTVVKQRELLDETTAKMLKQQEELDETTAKMLKQQEELDEATAKMLKQQEELDEAVAIKIGLQQELLNTNGRVTKYRALADETQAKLENLQEYHTAALTQLNESKKEIANLRDVIDQTAANSTKKGNIQSQRGQNNPKLKRDQGHRVPEPSMRLHFTGVPYQMVEGSKAYQKIWKFLRHIGVEYARVFELYVPDKVRYPGQFNLDPPNVGYFFVESCRFDYAQWLKQTKSGPYNFEGQQFNLVVDWAIAGRKY